MVKKYLFISILIVILDQILKILFKDKEFFIINYETNTGIAFSLFQGVNRLIFILIALVIIALVVYYLIKYKPQSKLVNYGLYLMLAGAVSNLIDRIIYGYVIDYIDLKFWPIFNLADTSNVIGVLLLVIFVIRKK